MNLETIQRVEGNVPKGEGEDFVLTNTLVRTITGTASSSGRQRKGRGKRPSRPAGRSTSAGTSPVKPEAQPADQERGAPPPQALHWPAQIPTLALHLLPQMSIMRRVFPPHPPPPNPEPAAPNCATEFKGERDGREGASSRSSGMTKASGAGPRTADGPGARRSSPQTWHSVTLNPGLARSGPAVLPTTASAAPCPCLCCSWWLRVRFGWASRTVIFFVLFLFVVTSVSRDESCA